MRDAVADTGPLIHLDEAGLAEALHVFKRITVPTEIAAELRQDPRTFGRRLLRQSHVHISPLSTDERAAADAYIFRRLSHADRAALAMAQARELPLLTDDLDLRDAARGLDITSVGTIGLIVRAATTRVVTKDEAKSGLDRLLKDSTMFLTDKLVKAAKKALD